MTAGWRGVWRELATMERADLALRLLLIALLFQPVGQRWLRPVFVTLAALGLLSPRALRSPALWAALTLLAAARVYTGWPNNDNHAYLLIYWCLAAALASASNERDRSLAWNGRALIGLTFLFATLWKVGLSPDFTDGGFFRVTLVDDPRFEHFTKLAAGLDERTFGELRAQVRAHHDGIHVPGPGQLSLPPRLLLVANALTASTLVLEAGVALAFLAPLGWRIARARDALLAVFCATTYALAPVAGFGWLLLSMGIAHCEPERERMRLVYLVAFVVVLFATRWPWLDRLARVFA